MQIQLTKTGEVISLTDFYERHPHVQLPQPPTDEALAEFGAQRVLEEPGRPEYPRFEGNAKLDLFTQAEQLAVVTDTMTDPVVKLLYDRLLGAKYWSYEDPETEYGLSVLQAKGLITPERKAEIVAVMQPR